jgi:hypothetical protein
LRARSEISGNELGLLTESFQWFFVAFAFNAENGQLRLSICDYWPRFLPNQAATVDGIGYFWSSCGMHLIFQRHGRRCSKSFF